MVTERRTRRVLKLSIFDHNWRYNPWYLSITTNPDYGTAAGRWLPERLRKSDLPHLNLDTSQTYDNERKGVDILTLAAIISRATRDSLQRLITANDHGRKMGFQANRQITPRHSLLGMIRLGHALPDVEWPVQFIRAA